jgi:DNA-binding PadR family transcriptional regulator
MSALSHLENHVLARIAQDGPMTAYRVRQLFASSPTESLSSSTGSIYPAIRRLERSGLLEASSLLDDGRGTRQLVCTAEGRRQVRVWLESQDGAGFLAEDPLRTKALFLGQLTAARRRKWLDRALHACRRKLAEVEAFARDRGSSNDGWAHRQAIGAMRARIEWLEEWRDHEQRRQSSQENG